MMIIIALYQVFTLGYGCADKIQYNSTQQLAATQNYADQHLSVIYERRIGQATDFVHLQIDTTYREIGKGAYRYEVVCHRDYSLRSFDGEYDNMQDGVAECFISSNNWRLSDTHRQIIDYRCQRATRSLNGEPYEAWYTDALPYSHPKSRESDMLQGLILEAYSSSGNYSLRAKYISEQIG